MAVEYTRPPYRPQRVRGSQLPTNGPSVRCDFTSASRTIRFHFSHSGPPNWCSASVA